MGKNKKNKKQKSIATASIQGVQQSMTPRNGTLYETKYISIKARHGFQYAERKGIDSIAVLLTRNNCTEVMLRYQPLIANSGKWYGCPITGSMDHVDEIPEECAVREIEEEAGYLVDIDKLELLTSYIVGTQTNEICHLFTIDVTDLEQIPDKNEEMGEHGVNKWVAFDDLLTSPYSATLIAYGLLKGQHAYN